MSQGNVQAVSRLYDAFNRGDLGTFEQGLGRAIEWREADNSLYSGGNPYRSFAAIRDQVFGPTLRDFDDFRVDLEQLFDAGDHVIGVGRYRGKHKTTGKQLSAQFCHLMHVDQDGKLDRVQEYADTLQEAEVAGRVHEAQEMKILQPIA